MSRAQHPPSHPRRVSRRAVLGGLLAAAATPALPGLGPLAAYAEDEPPAQPDPRREGTTPGDFGFPPPDPGTYVRPIVFPVEGGAYWTDTWMACRGEGCSRRHEGQDLMAPKMRRLLACVDGVVVELRHRSEGNSLYLRGDDGWYYAYLHINNDRPGTDDGANRFEHAFAAGLSVGDRVRRGQHIAFVGDSGNAEATASHCHFEIRKPADRWYRAAAVNPKASLERAGSAPPVPPSTFAPFASAAALVRQQYRDLLGREADNRSLVTWTDLLGTGRQSPAAFIQLLMRGDEFGPVASIARLYFAYFRRRPDASGVLHWASRVRAGATVGQVSEAFARSSEFRAAYGSLSDAGFVDRAYRNVLGRAPDAAGLRYWVGQLDAGVTRGKLMQLLSDSTEHAERVQVPVDVCLVYTTMLRRSPDAGGFDHWVGQISGGGQRLTALVASVQRSTEYAGRF